MGSDWPVMAALHQLRHWISILAYSPRREIRYQTHSVLLIDIRILLGIGSIILRCIGVSPMVRNDLQGSLDLLVLKSLSQRNNLHGYGIALHIQRASDELLQVEE